MHETKKSLGQHWLHDTAVLQGIVRAAAIQPDDTVVEIGPGLGTLTEQLVATGAQVLAIEYDDDLLAPLRQRFDGAGNFRLEHADILQFDFSLLPVGYKIAANIPYYLTSHLLRILTDSPTPPERAVLLVQKEVAERVCAQPGDMSILGVAVQLAYEASLGELVPAELFTPPPKVDSQVLILQRRAAPLFTNQDGSPLDKKLCMQVVKAGFSAKRKKLRNTLSGGLHMSKEAAESLLLAADIDAGRRAETLSLQEWFRLCKIFKNGL